MFPVSLIGSAIGLRKWGRLSDKFFVRLAADLTACLSGDRGSGIPQGLHGAQSSGGSRLLPWIRNKECFSATIQHWNIYALSDGVGWRTAGCSRSFPQICTCAGSSPVAVVLYVGGGWKRCLKASSGASSCLLTSLSMTPLRDGTHLFFIAMSGVARCPNGRSLTLVTGCSLVLRSSALCRCAKNYEVTELVRLAYELTGSYSLMNRGCAWGLYWLATSTADDGEGWPWSEVRAGSAIWPNIMGWLRERHIPTFCQRPPLVSIGRLRRYAELARGFYGRDRALRALKYVVPGSASPMETALVMLLCLPCSLGGYGLPLPVMNYHVGQNMPRDSIAGKEYYVCDLYWPDVGLDVEYDSDLCHTGPDRIADDSARRGALKELGIDVITVTWQQIRSLRSMDALARLIARLLGKRLRRNIEATVEQRRCLHQLLLRREI